MWSSSPRRPSACAPAYCDVLCQPFRDPCFLLPDLPIRVLNSGFLVSPLAQQADFEPLSCTSHFLSVAGDGQRFFFLELAVHWKADLTLENKGIMMVTLQGDGARTEGLPFSAATMEASSGIDIKRKGHQRTDRHLGGPKRVWKGTPALGF